MFALGSCSREAAPPRQGLDPALLDQWPTLPDVLALRALLKDNNFVGLDSAYRILGAGRDTSFAAERRFARALDAFDIDDAAVGEQLAAWTRAASDRRPAHAVRFNYLMSRAFAARGGEFAAQTAAPRMDAFHRIIQDAATELAMLMQADSTYLPAYWSALDLARIGGDSAVTLAVLQRAIAMAPNSYQTRMEGIWALSPRWGGSLDAMWEVANRSAADSARNPYFHALRTFPFLEMAELSRIAGDTASALTFADSAVEVAREPLACITRAEMELMVLLADAALQDYGCASRLITLRAERVAMRALAQADVAWQKGQKQGSPSYAAALSLADSALLSDPNDSTARMVARRLREMN